MTGFHISAVSGMPTAVNYPAIHAETHTIRQSEEHVRRSAEAQLFAVPVNQ